MFNRLWVSTLFVLLLSLLTPGCLATAQTVPQHKSQSEVVNQLNSSTAGLVLRHGDNVFVYCTAVWVSDKTLLTANHCVEGAMRAWQEDHSKKRGDAEGEEDEDMPAPPKLKDFNFYYIVQGEVAGVGKEPTGTHLAKAAYVDKKHDLALLKVQGDVIPPHTVAKLAKSKPAMGEHVYVLGHVKGLYWSLIDCTVSAYRDDLPLPEEFGIRGPFMQLSGPVYFGNSGGGAFNSNGELVGIASFLFRAPSTSMFIPLDAIKTFLKVE